MNNILFTPYQLNSLLTLKNRIVMAPMTRVNATADLIPTSAMAEYYARRAAAGLIITEGTIIREDSKAYTNVPGIYNAAQIKGWQQVTQHVHQQQGLIFSQIWHVGRVNHPSFINGELPISPSATIMTGPVRRSNGLHYGQSRALSIAEIQQVIADYIRAAENAMLAGFDGIEIHGANGYLIDQFLHYHTNLRDDEYGGNAVNMARFVLEIVRGIGAAIGFKRVGLRLSPGGYLNEVSGDPRDAEVFQYVLNELNALNIAYIHTGNFDDSQVFPELNNLTMTQFMRQHYQSTLIASGSYNATQAEQDIAENKFDLIAIGRPFIANPDLIDRIQQRQALVNYDASMLNTLY